MRQPPLSFLDTNVPLYAIDDRDLRKQAIARALCASNRIRVSPQVLMEASSNLVEKYGYAKGEVGAALAYLLPSLHPISGREIENAWALMTRYQLKIWDAAVVAAALSARCAILHSEDFQHSQTIEGLRIVNPFLS